MKQELHTKFSWENFLKRKTLEMNRTGNKMHLRNTGDKHENLIKLAKYCINDSKALCYFIAQLLILERFFADDHIQEKKKKK